ncbi:DSPc [Seminavis robusta]|uniref:protein-tyrosine-phosphatase n=1 Tax=Seminavis robusta TaxID=568900 RepID=A0A9N8DL13_9STRA|nr:DSPc [Seminavis robusta]|eukprot:Sro181_g079070.1 DSPc (231) ;mRNA; f:45028-45720
MEVPVAANKLAGKRCSCVWPPAVDDTFRDASAIRAAEDTDNNDMISIKPTKTTDSEKPRRAASDLRITAEQLKAIPGCIYVADADAASDPALLKALGVTAVISVGGGHGDSTVPDYLHIGINDEAGASYHPVFLLAADFAGPILSSGRNLLVHCRGGMQRSPKVAAALIIRYAGLSAQEARRCVQHARPVDVAVSRAGSMTFPLTRSRLGADTRRRNKRIEEGRNEQVLV